MSTNANEEGGKRFKVKLTDSEYARLEREAAEVGVSPSEFFSKVVIEQIELMAPRLWR